MHGTSQSDFLYCRSQCKSTKPPEESKKKEVKKTKKKKGATEEQCQECYYLDEFANTGVEGMSLIYRASLAMNHAAESLSYIWKKGYCNKKSQFVIVVALIGNHTDKGRAKMSMNRQVTTCKPK